MEFDNEVSGIQDTRVDLGEYGTFMMLFGRPSQLPLVAGVGGHHRASTCIMINGGTEPIPAQREKKTGTAWFWPAWTVGIMRVILTPLI